MGSSDQFLQFGSDIKELEQYPRNDLETLDLKSLLFVFR